MQRILFPCCRMCGAGAQSTGRAFVGFLNGNGAMAEFNNVKLDNIQVWKTEYSFFGAHMLALL